MMAPGNSVHAQRPLDDLLRAGIAVTFMDAIDPRPVRTEHYRYIRLPRSGIKFLRRIFGATLGYRISSWIKGSIGRCRKDYAIDLVHVHWLDQRAFYCVQEGLHPLVITIWGSDINDLLLPKADPAYRFIIGEALRGADLIIADARDMIEKCRQLAGSPVPVTVLPLGIDTTRYAAIDLQIRAGWRERLNIPSEAYVLYSPRILTAFYGHQTILTAFALALSRLAQPAYLVFKRYNPQIGNAVSPFEMALRAQVSELGVSERIRIDDAVTREEVPIAFAGCDLVINYPEQDAFPITFIEAAASGKGVVSINHPSYRSTFAEEYFTLTAPGDVGALADAIVGAVNAPSTLTQIKRQEAQRYVRQEHDEAAVTAKLLTCYQQLLSQSPASPVTAPDHER